MRSVVARTISLWQFSSKRSLANWRLLSAVVVGVLLASAITSGTVVYYDSLRELALANALNDSSPSDLDILLKTERGPTTYKQARRISNVVDRFVDVRVGWFLRDRITATRSATFFLTRPENLDQAGEDDSRSYFAFAPRFAQHIDITDGRAPREEALSLPGEPLVVEALVPVDNARAFGVGVGDRLMTVPYWTDDIPHATVIISGLFERKDPDDDFWYIDDGMLQSATRLTSGVVPFFVSEKTFFEVIGASFTEMSSAYGWVLDVDPKMLNAGNAIEARINIEAMHRELSALLPSFDQTTSLHKVLRQYDQRLFFTKLPMFIVLILIAVVILYYVVTLASLLVDHRRGEISLLRSRGATSTQILAVFAMEGAALAVLAAATGPLLASAAVGILGLTPAFSDLSGGVALLTGVSRSAYLMSAVGGVLSFAALLIPAVQASRVGVTRFRQQSARPPSQPVFHRYYLDVALLIASVVLFRQLSQQGSVVGISVFGQQTVNQLQLVMPAIGLLAAGMVLLRLFPLSMSLASRLLSRWLPTGLALAIWQMARNPTHYARLSLLLILTSGLGMFAASFGGTLERNFKERVLYSTGSSIRVSGIVKNTVGPTRPITSSYENLPGVDRVVPVYRGGGFDVSSLVGESFGMLAVGSKTIADVAWFRRDFSAQPMPVLLGSLAVQDRPQGIALPESAKSLAAMVKSSRRHPSVRVVARLRDANGRHFNYNLGMLQNREWTLLETPLEIPRRRWNRKPDPVPPLTLLTLAVEEVNTQARLGPGSILIDDVRVVTDAGLTQVVETFDDTRQWHVLNATPNAIADNLNPSSAGLNGSSGSALFAWTEGPAKVSRGIFHGPVIAPLPVLASKSFVKATGHRLGDTFQVSVAGQRVTVRLADTIDYFPTLDTYNDRFLISDLQSLALYANLVPGLREITPNEMWLSTGLEGPARDQLVDSLSSEPFASSAVYDRAERMAASRVDPLIQAGWRALLFLAFGAVLILSCVGFLVHSYVSFRNREPQFALLKTIGLSNRQLISLVWLEPALIILVGMAVGTELGRRLGAIIIPFLGHDDKGSQVLPPFVIEVNWATLGITYAAMGAAFVVIMLVMAWLLRKMSLHRLLRMGETQ